MTINKKQYSIILANSGLTSEQVAEAAGISTARLNAIVNQKRVRPETAGKIARALGVDVNVIIEQTDQNPEEIEAEKWKMTLDLVAMLKDSTVEQREQWKQIVLKEMPDMDKFVNAALAVVNSYEQKERMN